MAPQLSPRIKVLFFVLLTLFVITPQTQASRMSLAIKDSRMTLQSNNAALSSILDEIRKQTGIEIQSFIPLEEGINADFSRVPINAGLTLLMRNYNYSIEFNNPDNENSKITNLFILSRTGNAKSSIVWREEKVVPPPTQKTNRAHQRIQHQLLPDHMIGSPDENDPMISHMAIDPLARLELQEHGMNGGRYHQIIPFE